MNDSAITRENLMAAGFEIIELGPGYAFRFVALNADIDVSFCGPRQEARVEIYGCFHGSIRVNAKTMTDINNLVELLGGAA